MQMFHLGKGDLLKDKRCFPSDPLLLRQAVALNMRIPISEQDLEEMGIPEFGEYSIKKDKLQAIVY